ncbi:MAG: pentapeptide repeat-containing protein [Chitinivibrionales bacterium]|nr:pentapeptide repeat-containing protein [Chitinivibrionales bacterium]MBD3357631.1 pentapeptide repeat-containing protein [Chitinivibrionales bacterium]
MPEIELRTLLNERAFEQDSAFRHAQSAEVMGADILAAIQKGKRDFEGADLRRCDLMNVDLAGANLRRAKLAGADLRGADLSGADLRNADLRGTFLMRTNLGGARLDGVKLSRAFAMKANFADARGLTIAMLRGTKSLHKAQIDEVLLEEIKRKSPKLLKEPYDLWKPSQKPVKAAGQR